MWIGRQVQSSGYVVGELQGMRGVEGRERCKERVEWEERGVRGVGKADGTECTVPCKLFTEQGTAECGEQIAGYRMQRL